MNVDISMFSCYLWFYICYLDTENDVSNVDVTESFTDRLLKNGIKAE